MQLDKPTWYLKKTCPCCGQGYPSFFICPDCKYLTVVCEEVGRTFVKAKNLELGFASICPGCNKTSTADFILADSLDIIKAGFTPNDYE